MSERPHVSGDDTNVQRNATTGRDLSAVRENREDLEALAQSDLPVAWVAQALLDAEAGTRGG